MAMKYNRGFDLELLDDLINDRSCTSKEKMQKLRLFAKKIKEDETLLAKMKLVADEIRQQRQDATKQNQGMTMASPDLHDVETLFNPVSAQEAAEHEGAFITRNLNIAPFYQQYRHEKRKILDMVGARRQQDAIVRKARCDNTKQQTMQHHLKRWDVFAVQKEELIDMKVALLRRQKLAKQWLVAVILLMTVLNSSRNKERLYQRQLLKHVRRVSAMRLAASYLKFLHRHAPDVEARARRRTRFRI